MADSTRADIPQIRFMLSGSGHYTFGDGSKAQCPAAMVKGTTTSATRITAKGPLVVFGIGLLPADRNAIIGASTSETTDIVEDARAALSTFAAGLLHTLPDRTRFDKICGIADI